MTNNVRWTFVSALFFCSIPLFANKTSLFCPQNYGYIKIGMNQNQVTSACGTPISKHPSNTPLMQKVPVQQIFYNNQGSPKVFYGVWSIPTGGTGGGQLEVDVINNKVSSMNLNGSSSGAASVCRGINIQKGTPVGQVFGACGPPTLINRTFIYQPVQTSLQPEVWVYQMGPNQPPVSLTFVNGTLQSID